MKQKTGFRDICSELGQSLLSCYALQKLYSEKLHYKTKAGFRDICRELGQSLLSSYVLQN
jgi:hypothetical protein